MTADEAIAIVDEKVRSRTRYEDQHPLMKGSGIPNDFLDEVLVKEIKKLRQDCDDLEEALSELLDEDDDEYEDFMEDDCDDCYEEGPWDEGLND